MAMRRRSEHGPSGRLWPGFVDALTALLLVLMFVLSIFMIVQFVLREELTGKDRSLAALQSQLGLLTDQLVSAESEAQGMRSEIGALERLLADERATGAQLAEALEVKTSEGEKLAADLEQRLAELAAMTETLERRQAELAAAETALTAAGSARDAAETALSELRRSAAQVETIRAENERLAAAELTFEERLAALELELDKKRAEAEETLTLLAAAEAKRAELDDAALAAARESTERERVAAFARATLQSTATESEQSRRAVALLNAQVRELRDRIAGLQLQLDVAAERDAANQVEIVNLGQRLNQALAQKVGELQRYRSEFFGRLRDVLGEREGVRVVGDRFVFQSEVLFESGSADLGEQGKAEIARFAGILREVAAAIPPEIEWILRVDGHTDVVPIGPNNIYRDNWELSQARALSVVKFLVEAQSIPSQRLVAAGFGEYQPIDPGRSPEALARNRRIELKLTER